MKSIAILALQGAFKEHEIALQRIGNIEFFEIRNSNDWKNHKDGLIIPGGESTSQLKLLNELNLLQPIREEIKKGLPVFGTCAGLILLAKKVINENKERISTMDIEVCRNAYGKQSASFYTKQDIEEIGKKVPMTFIRAPYIEKCLNTEVKILAEINGNIVAAKQKNMLVTSFHPELNNDLRIHQYFLSML